MKKLIVITLMMLVGMFSFSQDSTVVVRDTMTIKFEISELEKEIKSKKTDSWMQLSTGLFSHLIASTHLINGIKTDLGGFIMYNTVAIPFDVMSIISFSKVRKKKKKLKELEEELENS